MLCVGYGLMMALITLSALLRQFRHEDPIVKALIVNGDGQVGFISLRNIGRFSDINSARRSTPISS